MAEHRAGFVTIIGRPNVGKSTLLNELVGRKISITSRKPQTTRHRIVGVLSREDCQFLFVDTPGLHPPSGRTINKIITRTARASLVGVDAVVMLIACSGWTEEDRYVLRNVEEVGLPVLLAINKVDTLKRKERLLPLIQESSGLGRFEEIVPISAKSGTNLEGLLAALAKLLPAGPPLYPEGQDTDRSTEFLISELIREQLFRQLGEELPYETAVRVSSFDDGTPALIDAQIWVEREGQKGMVVGKGGRRIKKIGTVARKSIERSLGKKVHLDLVVKVRRGWADNHTDLHSLGYAEDA